MTSAVLSQLLQILRKYFPCIANVSCCFYYVRRSVLFKVRATSIEASKFFFIIGDGKLFLQIPKMQVVCTCYCYNFHIFLSFASDIRVMHVS